MPKNGLPRWWLRRSADANICGDRESLLNATPKAMVAILHFVLAAAAGPKPELDGTNGCGAGQYESCVQACASAPDISQARCELTQCATAGSMPVLHGSPYAQASFTARNRTIGKQLHQTLLWVANWTMPTWLIHIGPAGGHIWASTLGCASHIDAWKCIFGHGELMSRRTNASTCKCPGGSIVDGVSNRRQGRSRRAIYITLLQAAVFRGKPASPALRSLYAESGSKTSLPTSHQAGLVISVHVRNGDSCEFEANVTGMGGYVHQKGHAAPLRTCLHPSVHLAAVKTIMRYRAVGLVLLASDSASAIEVFRKGLPPGVALKYNEFDRRPFERLDHEPRFVEDNPALRSSSTTTSSLADWRLLARGELLVGSMCGSFTKLIHSLMAAKHGREMPAISLDGCAAQCCGNLQRPQIIGRSDRMLTCNLSPLMHNM